MQNPQHKLVDGLTRRQLLWRAFSAAPVPLVTFGARRLAATTEESCEVPHHKNRALIIIQLTGGNDILNTVVPFEDSAYHKARPTLRIVAQKAIPVTDSLAFHPALKPLEDVFRAGTLAVVQGVGYPNSSRGHDEALRDWHTARPGDEVERTGWLGRACDELLTHNPIAVHAVFVGRGKPPQAIIGRHFFVPRITREDDLVDTQPPYESESLSAIVTPAEASRSAAEATLVDFVREVARQAWDLRRKVIAVLEKSDDLVRASRFDLERVLRLIGRLIQAELGIRIFYVDFGGPPPGGFDTHANQLENHDALLSELAWSLKSFVTMAERGGFLDRVLLMTFSEFGRTLAENGRHGTEHGAASSLFVVGSAVNGGILGEHPSLSDLDQGGLRYHTDFRCVYATLLNEWLGVSPAAVLGKLPGPTVPLLKPGV